MTTLPIREVAPSIVRALQAGRRMVLEAPTGSGKSTQVPQMLLDSGVAGDGRIVVLQPRRIAARMLARRVAWERGGRPGQEVGYRVRLESVAGPATRILYETDGVLLRQLLSDPALSDVSVILFDEFHERHLYGDLLLGCALRLQETLRPDLKIGVMSATLDSDRLAAFLEPCTVVRSEGRVFPVEVRYLPPGTRTERATAWELAAQAFDAAARSVPDGDVLVFMPGSYEIRKTLQALESMPAARGMLLLPLHGELPPDAQDQALAPQARRKVVVATNVAETSLTIDGVAVVIDSGLARKARFDPRRGINTLLIEKISRASAEQRAGRAGRTRAGTCVRLWTEADHAGRPAAETPEIHRVDLAEAILTLKATGLEAAGPIRWLDAPDPAVLAHGMEMLQDLGALDGQGAITARGRALAAYPMQPRHAAILEAARARGCTARASVAVALGQERSILVTPRRAELRKRVLESYDPPVESDVGACVHLWEHVRARNFDGELCRDLGIHEVTARRAVKLAEQFLRIAEGGAARLPDVLPEDAEGLARCILAGFADHLARRVNAGILRCELVHRRRGTLARDSVVRSSPLLVATEINEIGRSSGETEVEIAGASAVRVEWLDELFPGGRTERRTVAYDSTAKAVVATVERVFRDLAIEPGRRTEPTAEEAAPVLAAEVLRGNLALKEWDDAVERYIARVNCLAAWCPELELPPIDAAARRALIEEICHGAVRYKEIREKPCLPVVRAWLSREHQAALDAMAPDRVNLANGRTPKVTYAEGKPPSIAMRIQELYGVERPILVAGGKVRIVVQILAPSQRPVQVTDDLGGFWRDSYPRVKQELQRKYPKHEWR